MLGHAVAFFFFSVSFLGLGVQFFGAKWGFPAAVVLLVAVAAASEALQPTFASRPAEWDDVVSDMIGVGVAAAVVGLVAVVFRRRTRVWGLMGLVCLVALAVSLGSAIVGTERFETRFECWGQGLDRIASAEGQPIIVIEGGIEDGADGQTVQIGDEARRRIVDGLVAGDSADLRCSVVHSGSYSIVATVVPDSIESGGPTRIFTSSDGTLLDQYNTHLGQDFGQLSIRIRSGEEARWELLPDVFVAGQPVTIAVAVSAGNAVVFVDGEIRTSFSLRSETFRSWNETYPILIGDESTRNRTFEGVIDAVSVFDRALVEGDPALEPPAN